MSYSPAVAKILVEKYGFVTQPDGAVVSPTGYTRNEAGETVKYTAPAADPVTPAAPVVAADPGTAALDPVTSASASMADVKQDSINQLMALANQTAASNQQLSDQLGFGALPPEPAQTIDDLKAALDEGLTTDKESYTYSGDKTGKEVTFADGSVLTQKGFSFKYADAEGNPLDLNIKPGLKQSVDGSKNQALNKVVSGIKKDLTNNIFEEFGGVDSELVSGYLDDKAAEAKRLSDKDKDAFYGKNADSTGKITSGKNKGKDSQALIDHEKRLSLKSGDGFMADLALAKDDLVTRGGQLGGDLKDLASSVGGGITDLVDKGKQFLGITAPGAVLSSSAPPARPAGLDNFGYDEDENLFDSAIYNTTPNIFGEVGRGSGYNIPTSVGGGFSDDVYQDAILRGGGGSSLGPAAVGTDDRGFTSGVLPSSMLGQLVGGGAEDFLSSSPKVEFLQKNDYEWYTDWISRGAELPELEDRYNSFLTGERGGRGPTVTVDGYQGLAYDELGPSPGDLAAIGGDVVTLGEGMNEGQAEMYNNMDGTYNLISGGDGDDTSLNEGQGDIFTNIDPVTYDPITGGDDSGGGGAAGGGDSGGGASGGGDQGGGDGGGGGSDPVDPGPVDPDPVDPDDPVGYDPLVPFIPSNIQVPSFLQPSLVPYSGNTYAAPSMDFIRANQVNPFADPYANVFVARNGGIVSLR